MAIELILAGCGLDRQWRKQVEKELVPLSHEASRESSHMTSLRIHVKHILLKRSDYRGHEDQ